MPIDTGSETLSLESESFFLDMKSPCHIFLTKPLIYKYERCLKAMKDYFSPNINEQSQPGTAANSNALCRSGSDADACISGSGCVGCNTGSDVSNCVHG